MPDLKFADLSNNQAQPIDWAQYKAAGHVLIGLKATEGTGFKDATHNPRARYAHQRGIHVAHYHFAHAGESAGVQADVFWTKVKPVHGRHDYCVLDIEDGGRDGKTMQEVVDWCRQFELAFFKVSGYRRPIVYSNEAFLRQLRNLGYRPGSGKAWIAAYGPHKPSLPGIQTWSWQYTDGTQGPLPHSCAGIGKCDISTLNLKSYLWLRVRKP